MTWIAAVASALRAVMATSRGVGTNGAVFDPDADKSIVFGDANAAVAIGYAGMAHIGAVSYCTRSGTAPHGPLSVNAFCVSTTPYSSTSNVAADRCDTSAIQTGGAA